MAETPQGYRDIPEAEQKKAKAFFDQGKTVGDAGQYDYAIEMYLSGLAIDPDAVEAHAALRDAALRRKASGGKSLGMFKQMGLRPTKDDKQNMLIAERKLAYDPGNPDNMVSLLQNAHKAGFYDTVLWIGPILLRANADSKSPEFNKFIILRDIYKDLKQWKLAVEATQYAMQLKPNEMDLQSELKNLGAQQTMYGAGYIEGKSFREQMANRDAQDRLLGEERDVKSVDMLMKSVNEAEAEYKVDPDEPGKLMKLVDALLKTEELQHENRALELLDAAYTRTRQFRFRMQVGRIKIMQMKRMGRSLLHAVKEARADEKLKAEWDQFSREQSEFELKEYTLWAENYPTDLTLKFQVAAKLFELGRYDESIPLFQHARSDPKQKVDASVILGRAFLESGYVDEAAETLQAVIDEYQVKGDDRSREMYYWQGRAFETKGNTEMALKRYSQVAQWEFTYKDVQTRIKRLRSGGGGTPAAR